MSLLVIVKAIEKLMSENLKFEGHAFSAEACFQEQSILAFGSSLVGNEE